MVNVVNYIVQREIPNILGGAATAQSAKALAADRIETPPSVVQMIEHNLERLNRDEQAMLEAASVAGAEFPVAAVAAMLEHPISEIEACFTSFRASSSSSNRTVSGNGPTVLSPRSFNSCTASIAMFCTSACRPADGSCFIAGSLNAKRKLTATT